MSFNTVIVSQHHYRFSAIMFVVKRRPLNENRSFRSYSEPKTSHHENTNCHSYSTSDIKRSRVTPSKKKNGKTRSQSPTTVPRTKSVCKISVEDKQSLNDFTARLFSFSNVEQMLSFLGIQGDSTFIYNNIHYNGILKPFYKKDNGFNIVGDKCVSDLWSNTFHYCLFYMYMLYTRRNNKMKTDLIYACILFSIIKKLNTQGKKFTLNVNKFVRNAENGVFRD